MPRGLDAANQINNPMSNEYGISFKDEEKIRARDRTCVYCHKAMRTSAEITAQGGSYRDQATIEHLNCDPPFYVKDGLRIEHLVICCGACNSSRGRRELLKWFNLDYCKKRTIPIKGDNVAEPVRKYLMSRRAASGTCPRPMPAAATPAAKPVKLCRHCGKVLDVPGHPRHIVHDESLAQARKKAARGGCGVSPRSLTIQGT